jgi:hypothetical protein
MPVLAVIVIFAAICGCTRSDCIEKFSADAGYGYEVDTAVNFSSYFPAATIDEIIKRCSDEGHACSSDVFITREAALCIVREQNQVSYIAKPEAWLDYSTALNRPEWLVRTILNKTESNYSGENYEIDAITGEIMFSEKWTEN